MPMTSTTSRNTTLSKCQGTNFKPCNTKLKDPCRINPPQIISTKLSTADSPEEHRRLRHTRPRHPGRPCTELPISHAIPLLSATHHYLRQDQENLTHKSNDNDDHHHNNNKRDKLQTGYWVYNGPATNYQLPTMERPPATAAATAAAAAAAAAAAIAATSTNTTTMATTTTTTTPTPTPSYLQSYRSSYC